ncbi:MAG: bifunctional nicotinamidase/pyrazinamidase [Candidatus Sumerlaeia bacterium]
MRALILVDIQNDFCPGGALPVPRGNEVVAVANRLMPLFDLVVATQDWHPLDHWSFAVNHRGMKPGDVIILDGIEQILWPEHCVQDTRGAEFHPDLNLSGVDEVFRKGTDPRIDSYSAFFDNARRRATGLNAYLVEKGVREVFVCGLATDYCVKFTALDAVQLGYETALIEDACRGVELKPGDVAGALAAMQKAGVRILRSPDLVQSLS